MKKNKYRQIKPKMSVNGVKLQFVMRSRKDRDYKEKMLEIENRKKLPTLGIIVGQIGALLIATL